MLADRRLTFVELEENLHDVVVERTGILHADDHWVEPALARR